MALGSNCHQQTYVVIIMGDVFSSTDKILERERQEREQEVRPFFDSKNDSVDPSDEDDGTVDRNCH